MAGQHVKIFSPLLKHLSTVPKVDTPDDELIRRFRDGDKEAGSDLFVKHYKMIVKIVLTATKGKWYDDDCLHAGCIGLYEAVKRYDATRGFTFLTYAVPWIRKYVILEVCADALPAGGISFGRDFKERLFRFIGFKMMGYSDVEIAELMKLKDTEVKRLAAAAFVASQPVSLTSIRNNEDEDQPDYNMEGVPTTQSAEQEFMVEEYRKEVEKLIRGLDATSQFILNHTLELNGCDFKTKPQITKALGLSVRDFIEARRKAYRSLKVGLRRVR